MTALEARIRGTLWREIIAAMERVCIEHGSITLQDLARMRAALPAEPPPECGAKRPRSRSTCSREPGHPLRDLIGGTSHRSRGGWHW